MFCDIKQIKSMNIPKKNKNNSNKEFNYPKGNKGYKCPKLCNVQGKNVSSKCMILLGALS